MINLKNAKKLYEVATKCGVKLPNSEWWHLTNARQIVHWGDLPEYCKEHKDTDDSIPAYTTDELLELMPFKIDDKYLLKLVKVDKYSYVSIYESVSGEKWKKMTTAGLRTDTPADALCLLAITLIDKKIIK